MIKIHISGPSEDKALIAGIVIDTLLKHRVSVTYTANKNNLDLKHFGEGFEAYLPSNELVEITVED